MTIIPLFTIHKQIFLVPKYINENSAPISHLEAEARQSLNKETEQARLSGVLEIPSYFVFEILPISATKTFSVQIFYL
jgi:hypothetical protein